MGVRIQHRRDTAANWLANDPVLAGGEVGWESDTNKIKIGDGVALWSALPYFGDMSGLPVPPDHVVMVDATATSIPGKVYNSWTDADSWIQTQTVGMNDRWAIYIAGRNWTESVTVRDWVAIIGDRDASCQAVGIESAVVVGALEGQCLVRGLRLDTVIPRAGRVLVLEDCEITGTSDTEAGSVIARGCVFTGGDFTNTLLELCNCEVTNNPKFGASLQMLGGRIRLGSVAELYGGTYSHAIIAGGVTQKDSTFTFVQCDISALVAIEADLGVAGLTLVECRTTGAVTALGICTVSTADCSMASAPVLLGGATWVNVGARYDSRVSGLAATDEQTALDVLTSTVCAENTVTVDATMSPIPGRIYNTWAAADAYVATQLPSSTNRWAIHINGTNAENIEVQPYVSIFGNKETTRLTGQLQSANALSNPRFEMSVYNCRIDNLTASAGCGLILQNCMVTGGTADISSEFYLYDCHVSAGNFRLATKVHMENCTVRVLGADTLLFPQTPGYAVLVNCNLPSEPGSGTVSFLVANLYRCYVENGSFDASGTFQIFDSEIISPATMTNCTIIAHKSRLHCTISLNGGFSIVTFGCVIGIPPTLLGGATWSNTGDAYKNTVSGLAAIDVQSAIDELADFADAIVPDHVVLVDATAPTRAGKCYPTWAAADAYVAAQTPSTTNRWAIKIAGSNAENIQVRSWVAIIGNKETTRLTGQVRGSAGTAKRHEVAVYWCRLDLLWPQNGDTIALEGCYVVNAAPALGSRVYMYDSYIAAGLYAFCVASGFWNCQFFTTGGLAFAGNVEMHGCDIGSSGVDPGFVGGTFRDCIIRNGSFADDGSAYSFDHCRVVPAINCTTAATRVRARHTFFDGQITMQNTSQLHTWDCFIASLPVVLLTGATWSNYGHVYQNTVSGLTATESQAAIDELSARPYLRQTFFDEITVDTSTGAVAPVDLLTRNITTVAGSRLLIFFSFGASNTNNNQHVHFIIEIDGVVKRGTATVANSGGVNIGSGALNYVQAGLAAGPHTVKIRWYVDANTGRIRPVTVPDQEHASLIVQELK